MDALELHATTLYVITNTLNLVDKDTEVDLDMLTGWRDLAINTLADLHARSTEVRGKERKEINKLGRRIVSTFLNMEFKNAAAEDARKDLLMHIFIPKDKHGRFPRDPSR